MKYKNIIYIYMCVCVRVCVKIEESKNGQKILQ